MRVFSYVSYVLEKPWYEHTRTKRCTTHCMFQRMNSKRPSFKRFTFFHQRVVLYDAHRHSTQSTVHNRGGSHVPPRSAASSTAHPVVMRAVARGPGPRRSSAVTGANGNTAAAAAVLAARAAVAVNPVRRATCRASKTVSAAHVSDLGGKRDWHLDNVHKFTVV